MAGLRSHKNSPRNYNYKEPRFYYEDLQKYKNKQKMENKDFSGQPINLATCEQLLKTYASNQSNATFCFNLRNSKNNGWKNSILPPNQSGFDKVLPPIVKSNIEHTEKIKNLIVHPKIKKFEVL
jgi:hypothetical protein